MSLHKIVQAMWRVENEPDAEKAHGEADDLLVEALYALAPGDPEVDALINSYERVGKWYA